MSAVTGIYRNGRIELSGPPPVEWVEGDEVRIARPEPAEQIDITGDSPEAIAAWLKWSEEFHRTLAPSDFPEELERMLRENKAEELSRWAAYNAKIEAMFP